jgi:hypothetical protein
MVFDGIATGARRILSGCGARENYEEKQAEGDSCTNKR